MADYSANLTPIYRISKFLDRLVHGTDAPEPVYRIEFYLAKLAGQDVEIPEPIYRIEFYLAKLCGMDVEIPVPIYRAEFYLAKLCGEEVTPPEVIYRISHWLADWAESGGGGAYYTLAGTLPLTLPHSLAAAIRSLVRTGSMTQTPAPAPSAPVYPVINNGTVQMVDDELPTGYKRLLGITFDGNFHYRTGEALTSDDVVTMTLDNLSTNGKNVFGSYNGANGKNFSLYVYGSTSGSYFRFGDTLKRPVYGGTGRRTITFGAGGTSGFAEDVSIDPYEFTTPANTYIGMLPNSSSAAYTGDIVGSITVSNRLEWIPTERESDGVIGYYERVNGNFIAPTGSGTPVSLGYDTSHLVPRVVGDTETLTVVGNLLSRDGETTGKIINADGTVSDNANYCISAPFKLSAGNYVCTWNYGSAGTRPFSVFACDADGKPKTDGRIFYQPRSGTDLNTGEFTVEAETLAVSSYRSNVTDTTIYRTPQTATVPDLYAVGDYKDSVDVVSGTVTRRVGMLVLTGEEEWRQLSSVKVYFTEISGMKVCNPVEAGFSTHFIGTAAATPSMPDGSIKLTYTSTPSGAISIRYNAAASTDDFKAYLAAQYAAGTPVIIWYPLAEPTTESVTPQALRTQDGTTIVSSSAGAVSATVEYKASEEPASANALMMAAPESEDGGAADGS